MPLQAVESGGMQHGMQHKRSHITHTFVTVLYAEMPQACLHQGRSSAGTYSQTTPLLPSFAANGHVHACWHAMDHALTQNVKTHVFSSTHIMSAHLAPLAYDDKQLAARPSSLLFINILGEFVLHSS